MSEFDYRFDAAPNTRARAVRYVVYTILVGLSSFLSMYFVHYIGGVLDIDVNKPIREQDLSVAVIASTLLGMLVVLTAIFAALLKLAKAIFTKFRV